MLVALDFTGETINYAYYDGKEVVSECLRNTIGFRTGDLFKLDAVLSGLMRVVKDMIECTGVSISETICAVPAYCTYNEKERMRKAAAECGLSVRRFVTGARASAHLLFQTFEPGQKNAVICSVHPDYSEFLLLQADGDVLRVLGSCEIQVRSDSDLKDPDKLRQRVHSELKALYSDLGMTCGEEDEEVYITVDEKAGDTGVIIAEELEACLGVTPASFEDDVAKGAFYQLMKLEDVHSDQIRKCFPVDCCTEGISISSGVGDNLTEVFRRNSPLPVQNTVELMISSDNVLYFYAGNYGNRDYDDPIGSCRIPDAYRGQKVHVKITLNEDGIVEYVVLDASKQIIYPRRTLR